ncbi:EAL domain-containing protein, partial [Persephonella sp.]
KKWLVKRYRNTAFVQEKLKNKQLEVMFQPIFDTFTGEIFALETLARIRNEDGNLVSAGVFIDTIYELGLIVNLDSLILEKIEEKRHLIKKITSRLFINVSSESMNSLEFLQKLREFVYDMEDFEIYFEITEQKLIEDIENLKKILKEFPHISFAIDDFGSGYSSLKTVADLAEHNVLKVLKIDGSLIKDLSKRKFSHKVVKAIASMVENLGIQAVAEFVEDEEILNTLKEINIKYSQGYYLSKPKTAEEILVMKLNSGR